mmetsp:Transcript_146909/g.258954  ORF Transcript_146909/g.258954 Transcript_146909/m.258954 type:complete len:251 (-) Transcript_146909:32-784(-)
MLLQWVRVVIAFSGAGIGVNVAYGIQLVPPLPRRFFPLSSQRVPPAEVVRRGRMMIKWNVRHRDVVKRFAALQGMLIDAGGGAVQTRLACHSENMHVTMNRWYVTSEDDVHTAVEAVQSWAAQNDLQTLCACPDTVELRGLCNFRGRVFYLNVQDGGALGRLYASAHNALEAAGVPVTKKRDGFTPHITVCKLTKSKTNSLPSEFQAAVSQHKQASLGSVPLEGLVLACKVDGDELNPPEICEIPLFKTK